MIHLAFLKFFKKILKKTVLIEMRSLVMLITKSKTYFLGS